VALPCELLLATALLNVTCTAQVPPSGPPASQQQQTTPPASTQPQSPTTSADPQAAQPQEPTAPLYRRDPAATITVTARTVVLDVMAVDAKGEPIKGLKKSDFQVLEDGAPQSINSFHEHTATDPAVAAAQMKQIKMPPNAFTNYVPVGGADALTVILLDASSIPLPDQSRVRGEMIAYMKTVPPGHPIAIFQMDASMHLIQGFSADPDVLRAAVEGKRDSIRMPSVYLHQPGEVATQSRMDVFRSGMLAIGTYLAGFEGRKNLIWFTGSVPGSSMGLSSPFPEIEDFNEELASASETLALSRVSIYPVDARGLETDPSFSAARGGRPSPARTMNFNARRFQDHSAMQQMAEETGGHAFYNTNGFKQAIQHVVDSGSFYYTVAYTPANKNWDGSYRKIHIDLAGNPQGVHLQYRQGYRSRPPTITQARRAVQRKQQNTSSGQTAWMQPAVVSPAAHSDFVKAMQLGAIPPTQVLFNASISPGTQIQKLDKSAPPPPGESMREDLRGKPFREYHLLYAVTPRFIKLTPAADGKRQGDLEFVAVLYDDTGAQINSALTTLQLNLSPETYAKLMTNGLGVQQNIAVPLKGNYFLRLGIRDLSADKVGVMEIPVEDIQLNVAGPGQGLVP
jgi:VWFA-related protein